jgi:hypothetical protein
VIIREGSQRLPDVDEKSESSQKGGENGGGFVLSLQLYLSPVYAQRRSIRVTNVVGVGGKE